MARFVYIHVPKCGGSSFGAALRLRYLTSQSTITLGQGDPTLTGLAKTLSDYGARGDQLSRLMNERRKVIAGHVRYDPVLHQAAAQTYRFITLLREPVERFVSHFRYLQRRHPDPTRPDTLEGFMDTPEGRHIGAQLLFYFGTPDGTTSTAVQNLARFDLAGDLSAPAQFARSLGRLTGTPIPVWHRNSAPKPTHIPKHLRSALEAHCAADLEIYHGHRSQRAAA